MSPTTDLKGSSFTLPVLYLAGNDLSQSLAFLTEKVETAPSFFTNAPVVLNIEAVTAEVDFKALKDGVLTAGMIPVGVAGCKDARARTMAAEAGLAVMSSSKSATREQVVLPPTKVIRTPIRSGQQIYAKDCDLVILNHVSAGAEVIADGSIHIHGTLRGRAIAGASGQTEAKIICHDLQAELVSINGNYWLSDQIDSELLKKKVMVSMVDDQLKLETLSI
ncbi:septum site-determining protein MinC [Vibrio sp. SCSIO 43136]|uniref:septum site-determining protein MinC n=1 Tax=Vibrio sp. SCSIO 43136 TaxID=2819101 RepID=UPI002075E519|nr:septum site-determining protein MinC [Vibrio sp. SCSIO 43136]USD64517.1 septum site-determining protein MinC [Vibrio sp. SCSIO 43136]